MPVPDGLAILKRGLADIVEMMRTHSDLKLGAFAEDPLLIIFTKRDKFGREHLAQMAHQSLRERGTYVMAAIKKRKRFPSPSLRRVLALQNLITVDHS